jgi:hypothetical protein
VSTVPSFAERLDEQEPNPFHEDDVSAAAVASASQPWLSIVPIDEFAAKREASGDPLLGSAGDMALAAAGTIMFYGDGGTSKTSLSIDGGLHLAAGDPWLGLKVPRPLTVLLIENEGPRGPFRAKLDRKRASWQGSPFEGRVHVLEEPWAAFTFANEQQRAALAELVAALEIDLIVCGPLATLGAIGGGTPEEVSAFETLLVDLRKHVERPLALWLVHHENKAGDVSGAWERLPDALVHVRLEGRERTLLHWRKTRWSSTLHGARWSLAWACEREGFELVDEEASAAAKAAELEEAREWIVEYLNAAPGPSKSAVETAFGEAHGKGGRALARRAIEAELAASTPRLAIGTGKSPAGKYLYPASEADSPLAADLFGECSEMGADPAAGGQLADSPPPRRGKANGGESDDGVER